MSTATIIKCHHCKRVRTNRGRGLCFLCHEDPAILARYAPAGGKQRVKRRPPSCWACGKVCPKGTHILRAGWFFRELSNECEREIYCPECFAEYGFPDPAPYLPPDQFAEAEDLPRDTSPRVFHCHLPRGMK